MDYVKMLWWTFVFCTASSSTTPQFSSRTSNYPVEQSSHIECHIMSSWQHDLCGCFDNCMVCICTYFIPCYVAGKIAESVGDSCFLHSFCFIFLPIISLFMQCCVRGKIRQQRGIEGSDVGDFCVHLCCMPCALCQEANELNALGNMMMAAEETTIERA